MKPIFLIALFFSTLASVIPQPKIIAQPATAKKALLFEETKPLEVTLSLDMEKLLHDTSAIDYFPAILVEHDGKGKNIDYAVKVKAAGNTRLNENVCGFPPLKLNFKKSELGNTVFDGQDKIKLITHCQENDEFESYVRLEYLAYKSYNILTAFSYRVRLVNITYRDISGNYPETTKPGFFVESDEQMAGRLGGEISEKKIWSNDSCQQEAVSLLTLFEFMIGNTDWWIHTRHNVVTVQLADGQLIPIPFDFDYAGLVEAPYSVPSSLLPITDVTQRFLKSECKEKDFYQFAINTCLAKKDIILKQFAGDAQLDRRSLKTAVNYIEDFYTIIESPDQFSKYINTSCNYFSNPETHLKQGKQ